jgi:hypothetical protein
VLEFDEYNAATLGSGSPNDVGAGRIIDIGDEAHPRVIANLRLEVNQPEEHAKAQGDPGAQSPVQGYAAHYCNLPTRVDPQIVACSFIVSGLRVFDISELTKPKEIAYYVAPTQARVENQAQASDFAMSQPTIVPERREIWFTDGTSGFYALRLPAGVWPGTSTRNPDPTRPAAPCVSHRHFTVKVKLPRKAKVRSITATLDGKKVKPKRSGRYVRVPVDLRGRTQGTATLRVKVKLRKGKAVTTRRVYHPCQS